MDGHIFWPECSYTGLSSEGTSWIWPW